MDAEIPKKLYFLFEPHRYKIVHGGRGSSKSWTFARALLLLGASKKLRILCAREVQESIKQSVHKLLKDQIQLLNLGAFYKVLDAEIRGLNGTEIAFTGLSALTVETIKSFEGYDICWVEEGQSITDNSWTILIPTIRKDDSEIWVSFNPDLDTDPTYMRFITNPPKDCVSVEMNWRDNPWFNEVMEQERLHCLETDPEGYKNIWDGKCKPAVEGAIYYKEIQALEETNRICNIPYDPMLKVHLVMDLGWGDSLGVGFVQKNLSEVRIINYLEYHQTDLPTLSAELREMRYNWGSIWLPHDGFNKTLNAGGKSTYDILIALGWDVRDKSEITMLPIEDGIRIARMLFPRCYFDKENTCALLDSAPPEGQTLLTHRIVECLKRYHRKINKESKVATTPVHDEFCLPAGELITTINGEIKIENIIVGDYVSLPGNITGRVTRSGISRITDELMEITCMDGSNIRLTPNHTVLTNKGLVMASDLMYNHSILKSGGLLWQMLKLYSMVERMGLRETIIHATTNGKKLPGLYTEIYGKQQTVRSLKDMISTIKMKISSIIISTIWKCFPIRNIWHCMEQSQSGHLAIGTYKRYCQQPGSCRTSQDGDLRTEREMQIGGKQTPNYTNGLAQTGQNKHSLKPEMQLQNGIRAKKGKPGIKIKQRRIGRIENLWKKSVRFAVESILRFTPLVRSSATKIVKLRRYDVEKQPVYNITVDKHNCYIAGGLLVSNSHGADMFRYIAVNVDSMGNEMEWYDGHYYSLPTDTCDDVTGY